MTDNTETRAPGAGEGALKRVSTDPVSRKRFMTIAGGAGAASAFSIFLAACGSDDDETTTSSSTSESTGTTGAAGAAGVDPVIEDMFGKGDLGIVNYALTLEYLEAAFYADVVKSGLFKGADLALIKEIGSNEEEHVSALTAAAKQLGGEPAKAPETKFPLDDAASVLDLAATVENLGAAAYLGQAAAIESPEILAAALSIHTVEGRHAAALNTLTDQSITPDGPFAMPADATTVLDDVQPFIVS